MIVSPVLGTDKFINHACELNQHDNHGRSIVIGSVDKKTKALNSAAATNILHQLKYYRYTSFFLAISEILHLISA